MKSVETFAQVNAAIKEGDFDRAWHLLLPLAESGDAEAQYRLGQLRYEGADIPVDVAYAWLERAAKQNHPDALFHWASYCGPSESALIIKAEELGSIGAQYFLGVCYATGDSGYPKNESEAIKWYAMAARTGDPEAQYNLATMLLYGEGTEKDPIQARHWLEESARQGNESAAKLLAK
jgi:uncharacterized protein